MKPSLFYAEESFVPHVSDIDYGVLDKLVGYGVRRAQIVLYTKFLRALEPWDITPQRFSSLVIINRNPELKLTQLAQILGVARSGAVKLVDALANMGYVERLENPHDKRAYGLTLTGKGRRDLIKIEQAVIAQDESAARKLTALERKQLLNLLDKMSCS